MSLIGKSTNQSLAKLVEVGRRVSAPDFVAFLLLFSDIGTGIQRPYAIACETTDIEPVTLHKAGLSVLSSLEAAAAGHIRACRTWLAVSVLIANDCGVEAVRRMWLVFLFTPAGRAFPLFVGRAIDILFWQRFEGCELHLTEKALGVDPNKDRVLHPRCQCHSMQTKRDPLWSRGGRTTPRPQHARMLPVQIYGASGLARSIRVPEWTSQRLPPKGCSALRSFVVAPIESAQPLALQGERRFGAGCSLSRGMFSAYVAMDGALENAEVYALALAHELREVLGSVGTSTTMQRLTECVCKVMDWESLVRTRPTKETLRAVIAAYGILKPLLRYTFWPDLPYVEHKWPEAGHS